MLDISEIRRRTKEVIVRSLELPIEPGQIADDTPLLGQTLVEGMAIDSLAVVDIIVGLSTEFDLTLGDVSKETFRDVATLAEYVSSLLVVNSRA